jgi:hypothetical protein
MDASFEALSPQSVAASSSTPAGQAVGATPAGGEQLPAPSDQGLGGVATASPTPDNTSQLVTGVALPASPGLTGAAPQQSDATAAGSGTPQPVGQIRPSAPMIRLSLVQREVLDVVLLLLLAVALGEPVVSLLPARVPIVGGKLSLHDNPSASGHSRKGASSREGRAPPLR